MLRQATSPAAQAKIVGSIPLAAALERDPVAGQGGKAPQ